MIIVHAQIKLRVPGAWDVSAQHSANGTSTSALMNEVMMPSPVAGYISTPVGIYKVMQSELKPGTDM